MFQACSASHCRASHISVTRLSCPSPTPRACSNSCPSNQWCHPTISLSVIPFSFCFQSFSASGSFTVSQFFTSGGQSFGVSASASVLSMNIQDWFPLGLTGWISLQSKGLSRVFSNTTVQKHQFFGAQPYLWPNSHIYPYMTTGKAIALTIWTFVGKGMSLLFNTLSRLWINFSSVSQSCPTLCNPMDCNMSGFPVHHQLPELAQTHVHRVSDAIQPSHPLPSPICCLHI